MKYLMKAIKQIAVENPTGFTVKIEDLEFQKSGYVSAYEETQNCFDDEGLQKALKHATENDKLVGGWLDEETEKFYFDSCKVFDCKEKAKRFGTENKQKAIFDLTTLTEIRL